MFAAALDAFDQFREMFCRPSLRRMMCPWMYRYGCGIHGGGGVSCKRRQRGPLKRNTERVQYFRVCYLSMLVGWWSGNRMREVHTSVAIIKTNPNACPAMP